MSAETKPKKRRRKTEKNAAMMEEDTLEFIQAIDAYRRKHDRSFPAWSEVLEVLKSLGYRRVTEPVPVGEPCEPVEPVSDEVRDDNDL